MALIRVTDLSVSIQSKIIFQDVSFEILENRHYAIVGSSGSGKTTLLKCLAGQFFYKGSIEQEQGISIAFVEQQHHFKNLSNTSSFYYQQRFNSIDAEDAQTVEDYFQQEGYNKEENLMLHQFGFGSLWKKRLIQLSNGENKRVQLSLALLQKPRVLLLDNPFLGLDNNARQTLNAILETAAKNSVSIILVSNPQLIPGFITDVLESKEGGKFQLVDSGDFALQHNSFVPRIEIDRSMLEQLISKGDEIFNVAIKMKNVHVRYGENIILEDIDWQVKRGERWSLSGPNGAGKSTLLSLINADNPQAYANEIYLFDKRRGRGESIWDIKKRIGYVSPELHLYFESFITVFDVVASGLFDTIGLFRALQEEQKQLVKQWIKLLHLEDSIHKLLISLPLGKQRLVLLARALVKNPPLLILDEPAQGLDEEQTAFFKTIIEQICLQSEKTLIYVTHLKEEVPSCVTNFIQVEKGRILKN